jgi:hypothetical protein
MKALLLFALLLVTGCASTRIISEDPGAEIFVDGESVGFGEASVNRIGPPERARVTAKRDGETVGRTEMHRTFTGMTVVWGLCSYYTGFYWGWYYPKSVTIPMQSEAPTARAVKEVRSLWSDPGGSVWMQPLH